MNRIDVLTPGDSAFDRKVPLGALFRLLACAPCAIALASPYANGQTLAHVIPGFPAPGTFTDAFGSAVATLGDLNGDGIPEILVGEPGPDTPGRVWVASATPPGMRFPLSGTGPNDEFGRAVARIGDVDGDDLPDFAVGMLGAVRLYSGASGIVLWTHVSLAANFGYAIAGAGDVNADGVPDLIVGAPGMPTGPGHGIARILSGATGEQLRVLARGAQSVLQEVPDRFGFSVAGGLDLDGDGGPDVVVGAPEALFLSVSPFVLGHGEVRAFSGATGAVLWSYPSGPSVLSAGARVGHSVALVGDTNGDGKSEVAVGAPGTSLPPMGVGGRIAVLSGGAPLFTIDTIDGDPAPLDFGWSIAGAGDVNGDGINDIVVGQPQLSIPFEGRAFVFSGTGARLFTLIRPVFSGSIPTDMFGFAVDGAGDVDGTGCSGVIVGSPDPLLFTRPPQAKVLVFGSLCSGSADTTPPTVTIHFPPDGAVSNATSVTLTATVADTSAVTVASSPSGVSGSFPGGSHVAIGTVPLALEGTNPISVTATDQFGNTGGTSIAVVRDTIAPALSILSPAEGSVLGESPATLTVVVLDATATTVSFGANSATLPPGLGARSGEVPLLSGLNSILVTAVDAAGNTTSATRHLTLDLDAPIVTIESPSNGASFGLGDSPIAVTATVQDLTATTVSSIPSGVSGTLDAGGETVTGAISLAEGINTITVNATDAGSHIGSASIAVLLDATPPAVSLLSPGQGAPLRGPIDLQASGEDVAPGTGIALVELRVDGALVASFASPPYETTFDTSGIGDGLHEFAAVAFDGKNNSSTASATAVVDNTLPSVAITQPVAGAYLSGTESFVVSASDGGSALARVEMLVAGTAPTGDASIVYALPVASDIRTGAENTARWPDGLLVLTARATDAAGNVSETSVTATVDNTVPERALVMPTDGQVVSGTVPILATASDANLEVLRIKVDGVEIASSTISPLSTSVETTLRLDGPMVVTAEAIDFAGHASVSSATVTVANMGLSFRLTPSTLNLKSKGEGPVQSYLEGVNVGLLVPPESRSVQLRVPGGSPVLALPSFALIADEDADGIPEVKFRFDRQSLIASIRAGIAANLIQGGMVPVTLFADGFPIGTHNVRLAGN